MGKQPTRAKKKAAPSQKTHQRYYISLPLALVADVNRWRSQHEIWTLTEALETLISRGLGRSRSRNPGDANEEGQAC